MTFTEAVSNAFSKYATFRGRASRSEFWWFVLFCFLGGVVLGIVGHIIGFRILNALFSLAILVPSLSIAVRRLHDIGRSGWWLMLSFIPLIGGIILIVWYATKGEQGANEHGLPA